MNYETKAEDIWPRELAEVPNYAALVMLAGISLAPSDNTIRLFRSARTVAALMDADASVHDALLDRGIGMKPYENGGGVASSPQKMTFVADELDQIAALRADRAIDDATAIVRLRDFYMFNAEVTRGGRLDAAGCMITYHGLWRPAEDRPQASFDPAAALAAADPDAVPQAAPARRRGLRLPLPVKIEIPGLGRLFGKARTAG